MCQVIFFNLNPLHPFSRRSFSSIAPAVLSPAMPVLHSVRDGKGLGTSQFFDASFIFSFLFGDND